jgi:hypothetical protein
MLIDYDLFDRIQTTSVIGFFVIAVLLLTAAFWKKRFLFAPVALAALLLAFASVVLPDSFTTPTFVATADAHGILIRQAFLFTSYNYQFADGRKMELHTRPQPEELVVNDTTTPLVVMPVAYGFPQDTDKPAATIEPFQPFYTDLWIQYFGRGNHQPPPTIMVEGGSGELRYWLTWNDLL